MKSKNVNATSQKNALFNEYKGFLFEYLVAKNLCEASNIQGRFYSSLSPRIVSRLSKYEQAIRLEFPDLLEFLDQASLSMSRQLLQIVDGPILDIKLAGKEQSSQYSEEDLQVTTYKKSYFFSLKFYKEHLGVNTKSGGAFSFITKYFKQYSLVYLESLQKEFNQFLQTNNKSFCYKMFQEMNEEVIGKIKPELLLITYLRKNGLSELPGQLPKNFQEIVYAYYSQIREKLGKVLIELYQKDKNKFKDSLMTLCGFSSQQQVQCVLKYSVKEDLNSNLKEQYSIKNIEIIRFNDIFSTMTEVQIINIEDRSFFDLDLGKYVLSIRVKPMNKFTSIGVKINCSLKKK